MGLLTGRPSLAMGKDKPTIIITNAYPLPIEGFETRVVADDQEVINYMIRLGEMVRGREGRGEGGGRIGLDL